MFLVREKIAAVDGGEVGVVAQDEQVLGVVFLGLVREVEAAGQDGPTVEDHHLVVGDGVMRVDARCQALFLEEVQVGVGFLFLADVEDDLDVNTAQLGLDQRLGDRLRRERVSLNENLVTGLLNLLDDHLGAAALGREVNGVRRWFRPDAVRQADQVDQRQAAGEAGCQQ